MLFSISLQDAAQRTCLYCLLLIIMAPPDCACTAPATTGNSPRQLFKDLIDRHSITKCGGAGVIRRLREYSTDRSWPAAAPADGRRGPRLETARFRSNSPVPVLGKY